MPLSPDELESRPSALHGMGVFTKRALKKGEVALVMRGLLIRAKDVPDDLRALQVGWDLWLAEDPANPHPDDFINHACTPNLGYADGSLSMIALRDIAAGEELTWHYATSIADAKWGLPCKCGAPECIGQITGFEGLPVSEQERLRPIALEFLRSPRPAEHQLGA